MLQHIDAIAAAQPAALLGMLYVLEGSTNGSRFIARSLARTFNENVKSGKAGPNAGSGAGLSYLDPYGDAHPERWQSFKTDLNAANLEDHLDAMIEASKIMFRSIADLSDELMGES